MIAFAPLIAAALTRLDRRAAWVALAAYTLISVRYSYVWQTEERLWSEAAARSPGKARPLLHLARLKPPVEALAILARAQQIAPDDAAVAAEQGRAYIAMDRPAEALAAFGRALAISPGDAAALSNRGVALALLGQTAAARDDFERALKANPCLFDARLNLKRLGTPAPAAPQCRYTPEQRTQLEQ
jgi:tetratricopeptide (TPR) repeat protein